MADTITISLRIENRYEDGDMIVTTKTDEVIPTPPTLEEGTEAYDDWAAEYVQPFTGTGRTDGDSFYDVEVTACSEPELVGREFDWGY